MPAPDHPVTHIEMETLLEPLRTCLQNIEGRLQDLCFIPERQEFFGDAKSLAVVVPDPVEGLAQGDEDDFSEDEVESPKQSEPDSFDMAIRTKSSLNAAGTVAYEFLERLRVRLSFNHPRPTTHMGTLLSALEFTERLFESFSKIEEPTRNGCLFRVAMSHTFEFICMGVILLNTSLVAFSTDWRIRNLGEKEPESLIILERCFIAFFSAEIILRLMAHHCYFFVNKHMLWNIFDLILVATSLASELARHLLDDSQSSNPGSVCFLRFVRLLKLARVFRTVRTFRLCRTLTELLETFLKSLTALFWGLVMLFFVLFMFSLIFMENLIGYLTLEDVDPHTSQAIIEHFGSLGRCLVSLYMSVTGGEDWSQFYNIFWKSGSAYGLLFLFFTFFFLVALFNILTGALVERAMAAATLSRSERIVKQRREDAQRKKELLEVCAELDQNKDGHISKKEFEAFLRNPIMTAYMASYGIKVCDMRMFFRITALQSSGDAACSSLPKVSIEEFVEWCINNQGEASARDMQSNLFELRLLNMQMKKFTDSIDKRTEFLEQNTGRYVTGLVRGASLVQTASQQSCSSHKHPLAL